MKYNEYLKEQGYTDSSIQTYLREIHLFTQWCKKQGATVSSIDYKTSLKYIKHLTRKGNSKKTVNHKLGSLKTYFAYLIGESYRTDNPLDNVVVRGVTRGISHTLLDPEELEDLYYSYEGGNTRSKRNKVIVGLLVYQGLHTLDLKHLRVEHLQLQKGKLYVSGKAKSNARELDLKPWQIMEFMEYTNEVRYVLLKRTKNCRDHQQLFPYNDDRFTMLEYLLKKLKGYNQKVKSIQQIRASVITNWLSQYNLRKVQYLAGHRYISSTERYLQDDLENLHEMINNFHPIH